MNTLNQPCNTGYQPAELGDKMENIAIAIRDLIWTNYDKDEDIIQQECTPDDLFNYLFDAECGLSMGVLQRLVYPEICNNLEYLNTTIEALRTAILPTRP